VVKRAFLVGSLVLMTSACLRAADLTVGAQAPLVSLRWADEKAQAGAAWTSDAIGGCVQALFYVDPDERALNDHVSEALEREAFPEEFFHSIAVINMDDTRIPDFILSRMLAARQRRYPKAVFLRDFGRTLVQAWGLAEDSYDIVLFDEDGKVLLVSKGLMNDKVLKDFIGLIREGVKRLQETPPAHD